jgi:hypothetical protein
MEREQERGRRNKVKRVSKKNGEISAAICQNIGQSKLKSFCVYEEKREGGDIKL